MKKRIAIVAGGDSAEREISLKSAQVVMAHLDLSQYIPVLVVMHDTDWHVELDGSSYPVDKNAFSYNVDGDDFFFDAAFIAIHGTPGENGILQGYFDLIHMPYSTCGAFQAALTFNKGFCNSLLRGYAIPSAKAIYIREGDAYDAEKCAEELGLPLFVKPNEAGSSFGISKVKHASELPTALAEAWKHCSQANLEAFINGREVSCGVHNLNGKVEALPLTEIIPAGEFFDYRAKYEGESQEITPANMSAEVTRQVQELAIQAFDVLQLEFVARADFIIQDGQPYLIEINTVPGLSEQSIIPQQVRESGITLSSFFNQWVAKTLG